MENFSKAQTKYLETPSCKAYWLNFESAPDVVRAEVAQACPYDVNDDVYFTVSQNVCFVAHSTYTSVFVPSIASFNPFN